MSDMLPKGWVKTTLGDVCLPVTSIQPEDYAGVEFTYFDIGGIDNESNRIVGTKTVTGLNAPSRARRALRKGDILFSTVRTYLRKIARVEREYPNPVASTGFAVIRAAEGVSSQFLFFQVLSRAFLHSVNKLQTGSSYPAVHVRDVFSQTILLPPAREQERIVNKLTAALSRLERGEAAARRARERVRCYRAAIVHTAVTGELTRAWRKSRLKNNDANTENGKVLLQHLLLLRRTRWENAELKRLREKIKTQKDNKWKARYAEPIPPKLDGLYKLPRGWAWSSIDQLSWASSYGTSVKCTYEADGPAVLRIPNIRNGTLNFEDIKFATSSRHFSEKDFVTPGDLLLIRTNGSKDLIGRAAIVKVRLRKKYSFASYLIRFRLLGDSRIWRWVALT